MYVRGNIYVCERRMYVCERRMYVCERSRMNNVLYGPSYACVCLHVPMCALVSLCVENTMSQGIYQYHSNPEPSITST